MNFLKIWIFWKVEFFESFFFESLIFFENLIFLKICNFQKIEKLWPSKLQNTNKRCSNVEKSKSLNNKEKKNPKQRKTSRCAAVKIVHNLLSVVKKTYIRFNCHFWKRQQKLPKWAKSIKPCWNEAILILFAPKCFAEFSVKALMPFEVIQKYRK